jgi:NTP pyrophosphatase (non-canonical NTP hydrolase)
MSEHTDALELCISALSTLGGSSNPITKTAFEAARSAMLAPAPQGTGPHEKELALFMQGMRTKLAENDHKPGWKDATFRVLFNRLKKELVELRTEIQSFDGACRDVEKIRREAVDVGNFAMMIYDNATRAL